MSAGATLEGAGQTARLEREIAGAQAVRRAVQLLTELAKCTSEGGRLLDLANSTGISRPTVHRILRSLVGHGLSTQDPVTKRYYLGHLAFELGLAAAPRFYLRDECTPFLAALARTTGDTSFLTVRSGADGVCIDRHIGSFPVKALTVEIGTRRPLGIGAGSLALIGAIEPTDASRSLDINSARIAAIYRLPRNKLENMIERTRALGYAYTQGEFLSGVGGVGVALKGATGVPIGAISVAAVLSRMERSRLELIGSQLTHAAEKIQQRIKEAFFTPPECQPE